MESDGTADRWDLLAWTTNAGTSRLKSLEMKNGEIAMAGTSTYCPLVPQIYQLNTSNKRA